MKENSFSDTTSSHAAGSVVEDEQEAKADEENLRVDEPDALATESDELSDQAGVISTEQLSRAARPLFQLPFAYGERWKLATYPGHDDYDIDMTRASGPSNNRPILAAYDGKVVAAGWDNGGGNYVRIDHEHGWETLYLHMIRPPVVRVGQRVSQGQHIGNVGSTGDSSGPHLHYEQLFKGAKTEAWFNGKPSGITNDATSKPRIVKSYNRGGKPEPAPTSLVHIRSMNADGTYGDIVPGGSYKWSAGWTQARPYAVGGALYLFLLKEGDGSVHIHRFNDDGSVGARVKDYDWSAGWTTVEFFSVGEKTYLLLLKKGDGSVHIHRLNGDGTVGARVKDYDWSSGWTQARPYTVGGVPYLFLLKEGDGSVHIHRLNDDGSVGARVKDYDWAPGWTDVEFYPVPSGTRMLIMKGS